MKKLNVLYVEDNTADFKLLAAKLSNYEGNTLKLTHVSSLAAAEESIVQSQYDAVLLDLSLPDADGLVGVNVMYSKFPNLPIVVLTGNTDRETGLRAIMEGAQDYVLKDEISPKYITKVCTYAIERAKIKNQLEHALKNVEDLNSELTNVNSELEDALERLQKEKEVVEYKNEQINSFINVLIHDLKNPLNAITSLTNLLLDTADGFSIPQLKFIDQIRRSSSSMLDNVLRIISTTQVNRQSLTLSLIADSPYFTINSAIDRFVMEAIQKNVLFEIKYDKSLPKVRFDKRSLDHVIANLVAFSIRHSEGDSRLVFSTEEMPEELKIIIHDKGLRLSQRRIDELFQDYAPDITERLDDNDIAESYNLSLAKKLVQAMDGTIKVESDLQKRGTIFWFTLQKHRKSIVGKDFLNPN